jgi:hypothetical protein
MAAVAAPGARPSGPVTRRRPRMRKQTESAASALGGRRLEDGLLLGEEGCMWCLWRCTHRRCGSSAQGAEQRRGEMARGKGERSSPFSAERIMAHRAQTVASRSLQWRWGDKRRFSGDMVGAHDVGRSRECVPGARWR